MRLLSDQDHEKLPAPVRQRLKIVDERAVQRAEAIRARIGEARQEEFHNRLDALVKSHQPIWLRLRALYQLIEELSAFFGEEVGCKRGCSHCCHMAVAVTSEEARMMGQAIGRKPRRAKPRAHYNDVDSSPNNPCTFLVNNECSIYEHRPLACRVHYSVDIDGLLCSLERKGFRAPYFNLQIYWAAYVCICGTAKGADIRDYFARERDDQ